MGEHPLTLIRQAIAAGGGELRLAGYLDLPSAAPPAAAAALALLAVHLAQRRPADARLFFAVLCFLSGIVVYHWPYDFVALLPALLVALDLLRRGMERRLTLLILLPVALTWFIDDLVLELTPWLVAAPDGSRHPN